MNADASTISLRDRPYTPETWERRQGSVYYEAGRYGDPMPPNPNDSKYFAYLYLCGHEAAMRDNERRAEEEEAKLHDVYEVGDLPVCRKCGRCGDWLDANDCDGS